MLFPDPPSQALCALVLVLSAALRLHFLRWLPLKARLLLRWEWPLQSEKGHRLSSLHLNTNISLG